MEEFKIEGSALRREARSSEFLWGSVFLLMVVVIGLVYDGGRKKKTTELSDPGKTASAAPDVNMDQPDSSSPPIGSGSASDPDTGATPPPTGVTGLASRAAL